jgi:hypothetical protein
MNQSVSPPSSAKGRRAWLYLSLLLPSLASEVAQSPSPPAYGESAVRDRSRNEVSRPYLRSIGPPVLRFQENLPPPDLSARPPPGGPPKGASSSSNPNAPDVIAHKPAPIAAIPAAAPARPDETRSAQGTPSVPTVEAIPPDDAQPKVRAEDFLPYFQFPGAETRSSDTNASNNAPAADTAPKSIPASSATYQEQ